MKPAQAVCRTRLADGTLVTITATRRERAGRADVKCTVPGDARVAERMQQAVRLARHTEATIDSRDQVVLAADRLPTGRDWELAAVLADRIVRGVWHARGEVVANGWSDAWELGRVAGHDVADGSPDALVGGPRTSASWTAIRTPARACRARAPGSRCTAVAPTMRWAGWK